MKASPLRVVVGYLIAVFAVGVALGIAAGYTLGKKHPPRLPAAQKFEDEWLAKYRSELALTADQVEAIRPLLPGAVDQLGGIWYRAIMTMGAVQESIDRKVEPLLDDDQRRKLVASIKKSREKRLYIRQLYYFQ